MCPSCRAFVTTSDRVCPYCQAPLGARAVERRNPGEILGGLIPHARFTTIIILLINTALFLAESWNHDSGITDAGQSVPAALMDGQWWRLITAGFIHRGLPHILINSWVLFDLGAEVETFYGTSRLIIFYFVSTVTGFAASSRIHGGSFSAGASAGIYGLIGAMLAFGFTERSSLGMQVKSLYTRWVIYGLALSILGPYFGLPIDLWAHAGGFAGGFLAGWLASTPRARLMWKEPLLRALAGVCIALTVVAFGMMTMAIIQASRALQ
jgi:rhomboid protease GluP